MEQRKALQFLWSGQHGLFELARTEDGALQQRLYEKEEALSSLAENDRFGPLARVRHGSNVVSVADIGNVLWADIDDAHGIDEQLARLPVPPSLLISSGNRGFWAYWKLTRPIASTEIAVWNRGLADRLDADRRAARAVQLARLPGSYRPETGKVAEVVTFSGAAYEPQLLSFLRKRTIGAFLGAKARELKHG